MECFIILKEGNVLHTDGKEFLLTRGVAEREVGNILLSDRNAKFTIYELVSRRMSYGIQVKILPPKKD